MTLKKSLSIKIVNFILVLFATLLITVIMFGASIDKLLNDSVTTSVVDQVNEASLKFKSPEDRRSYIQNRIELEKKS